MDSLYYQFVNYIQSIPPIWFYTIFFVGISGVILLMVKFYKKFDDSETILAKLKYVFLAIILFSIIAYITHLWR